MFKRAQKWMVDNSERVIRTLISETGKAWEDAELAELPYVTGSFQFWAKNAQGFLPKRRSRAPPLRQGPQAEGALLRRSGWSA